MTYVVSVPPKEPEAFQAWAFEQLKLMQQELDRQPELLRIKTTNVVPPKPRAGDLRFADGTNWNPGGGKGFYGYTGAAWVLL